MCVWKVWRKAKANSTYVFWPVVREGEMEMVDNAVDNTGRPTPVDKH